jgi:hypothetical protein
MLRFDAVTGQLSCNQPITKHHNPDLNLKIYPVILWYDNIWSIGLLGDI